MSNTKEFQQGKWYLVSSYDGTNLSGPFDSEKTAEAEILTNAELAGAVTYFHEAEVSSNRYELIDAIKTVEEDGSIFITPVVCFEGVYTEDEMNRFKSLKEGETASFDNPTKHTASKAKAIKMKFVNEYHEEDVFLQLSEYASNPENIAILMHNFDGELVADVTTNNGFVPDGWIRIKNYSENEGMDKMLISSGIINVLTGDLGQLNDEVYQLALNAIK